MLSQEGLGLGGGGEDMILCLRKMDGKRIGPRSSSFHPEVAEEPKQVTKCRLPPGSSPGTSAVQNAVCGAAEAESLEMQNPRPHPDLLSQKLWGGTGQSVFQGGLQGIPMLTLAQLSLPQCQGLRYLQAAWLSVCPASWH